jgi:hypothetical protein
MTQKSDLRLNVSDRSQYLVEAIMFSLTPDVEVSTRGIPLYIRH